jgi:hypothetical protein
MFFKPVDEIYLLQDWENEKINRAIHKNKDHDRYEWRRVCAKNGKVAPKLIMPTLG